MGLVRLDAGSAPEGMRTVDVYTRGQESKAAGWRMQERDPSCHAWCKKLSVRRAEPTELSR
jgi:hypothetical protein